MKADTKGTLTSIRETRTLDHFFNSLINKNGGHYRRWTWNPAKTYPRMHSRVRPLAGIYGTAEATTILDTEDELSTTTAKAETFSELALTQPNRLLWTVTN
jgi:hypothetical protein